MQLLDSDASLEVELDRGSSNLTLTSPEVESKRRWQQLDFDASLEVGLDKGGSGLTLTSLEVESERRRWRLGFDIVEVGVRAKEGSGESS